MFTDKVQKSLNSSGLMNNPNSINSYRSTLLEVDYAIGYETYKQLSVSYLFNVFVECSLSAWNRFGTLWRLTSLALNCLLVIICGDQVRLCVSVIHHCQTVTHFHCVTSII